VLPFYLVKLNVFCIRSHYYYLTGHQKTRLAGSGLRCQQQ